MKTLHEILSEGSRVKPIFDRGEYATKSKRRYSHPGHDPLHNKGAAIFNQPHEVPNRQEKALSKVKKPKFDIAAMAKRLAAKHNKSLG